MLEDIVRSKDTEINKLIAALQEIQSRQPTLPHNDSVELLKKAQNKHRKLKQRVMKIKKKHQPCHESAQNSNPTEARKIVTKIYYIILYYIILLYCIILYYIILYYIVLYYIILYYIILYYILLYFIILYYIIFHYIISFYHK